MTCCLPLDAPPLAPAPSPWSAPSSDGAASKDKRVNCSHRVSTTIVTARTTSLVSGHTNHAFATHGAIWLAISIGTILMELLRYLRHWSGAAGCCRTPRPMLLAGFCLRAGTRKHSDSSIAVKQPHAGSAIRISGGS
jgi:hypothetical protein